MARTLSQNEGELTLQKDNLPPARRLSVKGKTQIKVLKDIKTLKVDAWLRKALDRNLCGRIIKQAKVHTGL
jgi:hypothetical protein